MDNQHAMWEALKGLHVVVVAVLFGAMARAFTALHDGLQNGKRLRIELAFGAMLGVIGAGAYAYFDPEIILTWPVWLKISAAAAVCGGLGPVILHAATVWLNKRAEK
jgi:hypothetical protein